MKFGRFLILLSVFISSYHTLLQGEISKKNESENGFHLPGEFEKQGAVWASWSSEEAKKGYPYSTIQTELIQKLALHIHVNVIVNSPSLLKEAKKALYTSGVVPSQISFFVIPNDTIWMRDVGPTFLIDKESKLQIATFDFNNWGHLQFEDPTPESLHNLKLNKQIASTVARLMGIKTISTSVISEGGNRECNGRGTMLVVEEVEKQRNPKLTEEQLAAEYKRVLGVSNVIRLKKGMCQDEVIEHGPIPGPSGEKDAFTLLGNGGHIDAFCRFVGPNTILLGEVDPEDAKSDPIAKENSIRLQENYKILKKARDQDGKPFKIVRMPMTDSFYMKLGPGDLFYDYLLELNFPICEAFPQGKFPNKPECDFLLPTSYLNFLITNGVVLLPKYWKEGDPDKIKRKDERAVKVLESLFPDRKVVAIDVINLNLLGGGIHCMTQQEPAITTGSNLDDE